MFKQILKALHQYAFPIKRSREYQKYHYSFLSFLLLAIFCQQFVASEQVLTTLKQSNTTHQYSIAHQFSILKQLITLDQASALSAIPKTPKAPQTYIYVRTSPIIDDSWIGTLVNFTKRNKALNGSDPNGLQGNGGSLTLNSADDPTNTLNLTNSPNITNVTNIYQQQLTQIQQANAIKQANTAWAQDWKDSINVIEGDI